MKLIYNNKEVANNTKNYNELLNKPLLNSKELVGNVSLNDINVYNKQQVDNLIASTRSVKAVTSLPSPLVENTMYYVGPDADDNYHVYLVDSALTLIDLGMAREETMYKEGAAIDIATDNSINVKLDYESVSLNSEGKIYVPTLSGTKGSDTKPVYLNNGQITAGTYELKSTVNNGIANKLAYYSGANAVSSYTSAVGANTADAAVPIYMNDGVPTALSVSSGGTAKPVYLNAGKISPISATVGSATKPVYLNSGTITVGTYELKSTVNGGTANKLAYYSGANAVSSYASTVGSNVRPVYMNAGVPTQVNTGTSGNFKDFVPYFSGAVMEAGQYIDLHESTSTNDYDVRIYSTKGTVFGESNKYTLYIDTKNSKYNGIAVTHPVLNDYRFVVSDYRNGAPVAKTVYDLNGYSYNVTTRSWSACIQLGGRFLNKNLIKVKEHFEYTKGISTALSVANIASSTTIPFSYHGTFGTNWSVGGGSYTSTSSGNSVSITFQNAFATATGVELEYTYYKTGSWWIITGTLYFDSGSYSTGIIHFRTAAPIKDTTYLPVLEFTGASSPSSDIRWTNYTIEC